jgi:hypothetical protein
MSTRPTRRDQLVRAIVILAVAGGAFAAGLAYAAQPHMEAALNALMSAQTELKVAEHNKGGHRAKALGLVNSAIQEVQLGIAAGS